LGKRKQELFMAEVEYCNKNCNHDAPVLQAIKIMNSNEKMLFSEEYDLSIAN